MLMENTAITDMNTLFTVIAFIMIPPVIYLFFSEDIMPFGVLVVIYHKTVERAQGNTLRHMPLSLLPENLLYLADLFLNLAGDPFNGAFSLQFWIIAQFPGDLLDLTLHFVKRSFYLVLDARFHGILLS